MQKEIWDFMATVLQSLPTQRERAFLPRAEAVYFTKQEMHRKGAVPIFLQSH